MIIGYNTYGYEEYKTINPSLGDYSYKEFNAPTRYPGTMQTGHKTWENEFLKVTFEDNATLSVFNKETGKAYKDLLIFEDCADVGDGWNYKKPFRNVDFISDMKDVSSVKERIEGFLKAVEDFDLEVINQIDIKEDISKFYRYKQRFYIENLREELLELKNIFPLGFSL